ncbi:MAG: glycosyltransferase family 32 protein [Solirubrobacteraceae bacterium]
MSIPKIIYQTFKTSKLPLLTKWHIMRLKQKNPNYTHEFYDDARIEKFIKEEFEPEIYNLYKKINIGATKADFFRYAILYKKGGIYLDIDSLFLTKLNEIILHNDNAIICLDTQNAHYVQWALFF